MDDILYMIITIDHTSHYFDYIPDSWSRHYHYRSKQPRVCYLNTIQYVKG